LDLKKYNPELFAKTTEYLTNQKTMGQINNAGMGIYNALMKGTPLSNKIKNDMSTEPETTDLMA
jgi:hypothetical protein